jgi:hypothetical protein
MYITHRRQPLILDNQEIHVLYVETKLEGSWKNMHDEEGLIGPRAHGLVICNASASAAVKCSFSIE